jgi:hypothetical protein
LKDACAFPLIPATHNQSSNALSFENKFPDNLINMADEINYLAVDSWIFFESTDCQTSALKLISNSATENNRIDERVLKEAEHSYS